MRQHQEQRAHDERDVCQIENGPAAEVQKVDHRAVDEPVNCVGGPAAHDDRVARLLDQTGLTPPPPVNGDRYRDPQRCQAEEHGDERVVDVVEQAEGDASVLRVTELEQAVNDLKHLTFRQKGRGCTFAEVVATEGEQAQEQQQGSWQDTLHEGTERGTAALHSPSGQLSEKLVIKRRCNVFDACLMLRGRHPRFF